MSLKDSSLKAKLLQYSKSDLVDAICDEFDADYTARRALHFLESRAAERAIEQERIAFDAALKAREEYLKWLQQMAVKYGDGKEFAFGNLPVTELKRGSKLSERIRQTSKYADRATKRTSKALRI